MRFAHFPVRGPARAAGGPARPVTLVTAAALALLALGGCSISVQDGDGYHDGSVERPRSATDICRREVWRSFQEDHRITYDLPELTTTGTTQTVVQAFTLDPHRSSQGSERRTIRCTISDGTLTEVTSLR
ncbi:MAG: hypothetical protein RLY86_400 [Pseudomonadota bacterium]|jgi:hypothetical protein